MKVQLLAAGLVAVLTACGGSATPASPAASAPANAVPAAPASRVGGAPASSAATSGVTASAKPAASAPTRAVPAASGLVKLKTTYPNVDMGHLPLWVAEDDGIFAKHGLQVEDERVANSAANIAALLSGQTDIAQGGGSDAVTAAASGADVEAIAVEIPVYTYLLEVPAKITTVQQLKGAKIGVDSVGSSPDVAVRVALRRAGLDPDKDVSILQVGNVPTRASALMSGAIGATVLNPPSSLTVEDKGFHPLINLAEEKLPASSQATIAMRSWLTAHKALTQQYMDALIDAGNRIREDKPGTMKIMSKYLQIDDQRQLGYAYDFYAGKVYPVAPYPKPEMFKDSIDQLATKNPAVKSVELSKILDSTFVQSAVDRGLAKA